MSAPAAPHAAQLARALAGEFRRRLTTEYMPRIRQCVELLSEEQAWQRFGRHGNSIANLLMHLEGNVRQWVLSGLGGAEDHRDRDGEFRAEPSGGGGVTIAELTNRLQATVDAAATVVDTLTADQLLAEHRFQQRYDESGIAAVIHVIEHFSGHAGQIYAFTKQVAEVDLKFYDL